MISEKLNRGNPSVGESSDAKHRVGSVHSSEEGAVMALERRD